MKNKEGKEIKVPDCYYRDRYFLVAYALGFVKNGRFDEEVAKRKTTEMCLEIVLNRILRNEF